MITTLSELFTKTLKDYEECPNPENAFRMGMMLILAKRIKREIERDEYSFWMSCTAP